MHNHWIQERVDRVFYRDWMAKPFGFSATVVKDDGSKWGVYNSKYYERWNDAYREVTGHDSPFYIEQMLEEPADRLRKQEIEAMKIDRYWAAKRANGGK